MDAILINNAFKETKVTYKQLCCIEKIDHHFHDHYQPLCQKHLRAAFLEYYYHHDIIYVSFSHFNHTLDGYFVLKVINHDVEFIDVEVLKCNIDEFMYHQQKAIQSSKLFNMKYQLKHYYKCLDCLPTIASYTLQHPIKINNKSEILPEYRKAFEFVKNNREDINLICYYAKDAWDCFNLASYMNKIESICVQRRFDYQKIMNYLSTIHSRLPKKLNAIKEQKTPVYDWTKKRNLNSPSWRNTGVTV